MPGRWWMRHPQTRMWYATRHGGRGMLRYLWRDVRIAVQKPVRGRPSSVPRATWRGMSNQERTRAKIDDHLDKARRATNSSDIRAYMVPVLNELNPLMTMSSRPCVPRPHAGLG